MAAVTEVYVDPSGDANSGSGTIGDPYLDLQYALDTVTRDSSNGDRFNIKAGTDEVLTATLSAASYGTPSWNAPLVFQGYTSAAADGGQGGIDGNGTYSIWNSTTIDNTYFIDLHCHNSGSATILQFDDECEVHNCYVENTTGDAIRFGRRGVAAGNHIQKFGGYGVTGEQMTTMFYNYVKHDTNNFTAGLNNHQFGGDWIVGNIVSCGATGEYGIGVVADSCVAHNSVFNSTAGTLVGINFSSANRYSIVYGNVSEGFSGTGGDGYSDSSQKHWGQFSYNAAYNNTTNYNGGADLYGSKVDNETLSNSGFAKSGSDTFANRFTYFAPADEGNIIGGMPNGQDKGAVQSAAGGGGGGVSLVNTRRNTLIGR